MSLSHVPEELDTGLRSAGQQRGSLDVLPYRIATSSFWKLWRDDLLHFGIGLDRRTWVHRKACLVIKSNLSAGMDFLHARRVPLWITIGQDELEASLHVVVDSI